MTDDLDDILLNPGMRRLLRNEFDNGFESRVRSLRERYDISTKEAPGVITRDQMLLPLSCYSSINPAKSSSAGQRT